VPTSLFTKASTARGQALLEDALQHGAKSVLDSKPALENCIQPAILGPVTPSMRIYREESFAPLAGIVVIEDQGRTREQVENSMIEIANDTEFGLSAAIWSCDIDRARRIAEELESGAVHINAPVSPGNLCRPAVD
jgi:acyl-CoA reductase-like NAD-dependent aldehyde dehydrogenase